MSRRDSAGSVIKRTMPLQVRLPPLPRRPKTNVSVLGEESGSPWGIDNPALRQLATGGTRPIKNRIHGLRRSFRSRKVKLPEIAGRKLRPSGSARSTRSNLSTMSCATITSTRSLDMFRHRVISRTPSSALSAVMFHFPTHQQKTPGSALSVNTVSTIPLPPINTNNRNFSREDVLSTVIPDENDDDTMPCWAGQSVYGEPDAYDVTNKDYGNANELDPPGYFQQSPSYQGQEEEVPDYKDNTPQDSRCCEGVTPEVDAAHRVPRHAQSDGYANEQLPTEQGRSGIHVRGTSGIHVRGGDAPDNDQEELEYEARRRSSEDSDDDDEKELSAEEQMRKLFAGDFRRLPPMDRTSVRILLRASPSGFYEEREWIQAKCIPELQDFCAKKGLDFQFVDLDGGGYDHVAHNAQQDVLIDQLVLCQNLSAGPTVLALLNGDDLPRPLPTILPKDHFDLLCEVAERKDLPNRTLIQTHYGTAPDNPNVYVLKPIPFTGAPPSQDEDGLPPLNEWGTVAVRLRELLRKTLVSAVVEGKLAKEQAQQYLESESTRRVSQYIGSFPCRSQCYIIEHVEPSSNSQEGPTNNQQETFQIHKGLDMSRTVSIDKTKSHGRVYKVERLSENEADPASRSQQKRAYLNTLCADVVQDIQNVVTNEVSQSINRRLARISTPLHSEVLHHARICTLRGTAFRGPERFLKMVKEYLEDDDQSMVPLIISGAADKNKSQLMAHVAGKVRTWIIPKPVVIVRFLGTSPYSCDVKRVLLGVIYQICAVYGMAMPRLDDLSTYDRTISCFSALVISVAIKFGAARPLFMVFDSLERLSSSSDGNHTSAWIPILCPPNVYMLASVASDSQNLLDTLKVKIAEQKSFLSLDKPPTPDILVISSRKSARNGSGYSAEGSLSSHSSCRSTLCDEEETRGSLVGRGDLSLPMAEHIQGKLNRLEERYGVVVMSWTLSYLLAGEGITEVELQDALSSNTEVMEEVFIGSDTPLDQRHNFPHILWALIRRDLSSLLEDTLIDGKTVITIGNEQFRESVENRYLTESRLCECYRQFTELLKGRPGDRHYSNDDVEDLEVHHLVAPQPLIAINHRKLRRLPYTLYNSGPFLLIKDELQCTMLCNFRWILTKITGLHFYNDIEDYTMVKYHDDEVEFVRDLLMLCKHALIRDPSQLATQTIARLSDRMLTRMPLLCGMYNSAREWIYSQTGRVTLLPKYPCLPAPSGYLRATVQGPWHVLGAMDNSHLILWGRETGLEVWSILTQECIHHLCNPFTWEDTMLAMDSKVVFQTEDTRILGWDVRTGKKIYDIDVLPFVSETGRRQNPNVDDSFLSPLFVSEDKTMAVVRINKPEMLIEGKGLAIVDLQKQLVVHTAVESVGDRVSNCLLTKDSYTLVVTETQVMPNQVSVVRVYDILTMSVLGEYELDPALTIIPDAMHMSEDSSKVVIGCRPDHILLFQTSNCQPISLPQEVITESTRLVDLKLLPGDRLMALSVDLTQAAVLRQCDLSGNVKGPMMVSNTGRPKFLMVSGPEMVAFVGYLEVGSVDVWDIERACLMYTIEGHTGHITSCLLANDGNILYTGATDASIKLWKFDYMMADKGRKLREVVTPKADPITPWGVPAETAGEGILSCEAEDGVEEYSSRQSLEDGSLECDVDYDSEFDEGRVHETESGGRGGGQADNSDHDKVKEHDNGNELVPTVGLRNEEQPLSDKERDEKHAASQSEAASLEYGPVKGGTSRPSTRAESRARNGGSILNSETNKHSAGRGREDSSVSSQNREVSFDASMNQEDNVLEEDVVKIHQVMRGSSAGPELSSATSQEARTPDRADDRVSTATTGRTSDTNAKLEEIFRKLDQQALAGTPQFETMEEPSLITSVLGCYGEALALSAEITNLQTFILTEDGRHLVASYQKGPPVLWGLDPADIVRRMDTPWDTGVTSQIAISPDGRTLFGVSRLGFEASQVTHSENCIRVWDVGTAVCAPITDPPLYADTFALTPDMNKLVILQKREEDTRIKVIDVNTLEKLMVGEVACTLHSPHFFVTSNLRYVVTCDPAKDIAIWDMTNEDEHGVAQHTVLPIATIPPAMCLVDGSSLLLVGSGFGSVFCLELDQVATLPHRPSRDLMFVQDRHRGEVLTLTLSRDQRLLVTSSTDTTMNVIDYAERKVIHVLKGHTDMITCVDVSRDSELIASGSHDKTTRLWSATSGELLTTFYTFQDVFNVTLSLDGRHLVVLVHQERERKLVMFDIVRGAVKDECNFSLRQ